MKKILLFTFINICAVSTLKAQTCQQLPTCESLGFSKTIAQCANLNYIKCPFDNSMVYCLDEEYPLSACPTGGNCSTITKHKLNSCQNSYELSSDGLTCNACNFTNYPLSTCDANGTCSNYTCGNVTKYKLDSCNSGYNKSGNTCVVACSLSGYTLSSCPANGNCTSKTCSGTKKYKLNSCKSGYNKSGNTCVYACSGYYECGGSWQYCEGYTCSADSDMCSEYCVGDYFPYDCDSEYDCDDVGGVYRNGYCSEMCDGGNDYSSICIDISSCDNAYYDYDYECYTGCCDEYMDYGCDDLQCAGLLGTWIQECTGNSMCGAGFPFLECP